MQSTSRTSNAVSIFDAGVNWPHGIDAPDDSPALLERVQKAKNISGREALEIAYAMMRNSGALGGGHPVAAVRDEAVQVSAQLSSNPREWLGSQGIPTGGMAWGISTGGLTLLYSGLAINGTVKGIRAAWKKREELVARCELSCQVLQTLNQGAGGVDPTSEVTIPVARAAQIETQFQRDVEAALSHNACDEGTACSAFASSVTVFLRTALDMGLRIATMASSNSAAILATTTAVGIVGTIVLGPVVAGALVVMGAFYVHQARIVGRDLARDRTIIEDIASKSSVVPHSRDHDYMRFIERKLTSRERFAARFKGWNAGFLSGACLFALGTGAKVGLGIAALAGAAAILASPIGIGVILGLSIIGGIVLGVCSIHFVRSDAKSKRQQTYRLDESRYLGRRFDDLHTLHSPAFQQEKDGPHPSGLRAELYRFMQQRDTTRQTFLDTVARDTDKYFAWHARATDDPSLRWRASKKRQAYKNVSARVRFVGAYLGQRVKRATHAQALQAAGQVHARHADRLTAACLANWLAATDSHAGVGKRDALDARETAQRALLTDVLSSHRAFLKIKSKSFDAFRPTIFNGKEVRAEVEKAFSSVTTEHEADCLRLAEIDALLNGEPSLEHLKHEFLRLHSTSSADVPDEVDTAELNMRLARCLLEELPKDFTTARGILFDMHRHACHLLSGTT